MTTRSHLTRQAFAATFAASVLAACSTVPVDMSVTPVGAGHAKSAIERGDSALRRGNTDQALYEYVTALATDGENPETLYKVGHIHEQQGNLVLAESAFRLSLKYDKRHAAALEGLGMVQFKNQQYDEAHQSLTAAVQSDTSRWRAHNGLGLVADQRKDFKAAIAHYQAALKIQPESPMLLNNLGYSTYLSGDWDGAEQLFRRAIQQDPNYEKAYLNLGLIQARSGDEESALKTFQRVTDEPSAYNNLGYIYMLNDRYHEAENNFQRAISLSPEYFELAHQNLAQLKSLQNRNASQ